MKGNLVWNSALFLLVRYLVLCVCCYIVMRWVLPFYTVKLFFQFLIFSFNYACLWRSTYWLFNTLPQVSETADMKNSIWFIFFCHHKQFAVETSSISTMTCYGKKLFSHTGFFPFFFFFMSELQESENLAVSLQDVFLNSWTMPLVALWAMLGYSKDKCNPILAL